MQDIYKLFFIIGVIVFKVKTPTFVGFFVYSLALNAQ